MGEPRRPDAVTATATSWDPQRPRLPVGKTNCFVRRTAILAIHAVDHPCRSAAAIHLADVRSGRLTAFNHFEASADYIAHV